MTRTSTDLFDKEGRLIQGFDYDNQAWVQDGVYLNCGHKKDLDCGCYGRKNAGMQTRVAGRTTYTVRIEKTETRMLWIEVEAKDAEQARSLATEKARNGQWIQSRYLSREYNPVTVEKRDYTSVEGSE